MNNDNESLGNYKLVNCIASGNSCQVWEVIENDTTRRMAMKLLLPEKLADGEIVAAIKHEFNVAKTFDHPNILKYHELSVTKKHAYFVMDLFNAPSVKVQLYNDIRGLHIRLKKLIELVASALEHIHERGYLHRDMKPDNILMNKSAEVRLIDFSLASKAAGTLGKMLHRKQSTVQGTRTYMAPEQIMGKALTVQTDIYNFGITLFELLTGQPPYKGATPKDLLLRHLSEAVPAPSDFNPNVTPQMDLLVQRMLSKKPELRHKKMAEFMAEFRNTPLFKEEVTEKVELTEREKAEKELSSTLGERLDSRKDALRKEFGVAAPPPVKKKKPTINPAAKSPAPASAGGQGGRPGAPPGAPQMPMPGQPPMMPMPQGYMPNPMMPGQMMPGQRMPGQMMPGQMPMPPYPMMQMPQGPVPWVMQPSPMSPGMVPGMQGGPWMQPQQQPMAMPPQPPMMPGAVPAPGKVPLPVPLPPPTAVPAMPLPPPALAVPAQPVVPKPAPPAPVKAKVAKPPVAPKPGEGFNIGDLAGFDDLPTVS